MDNNSNTTFATAESGVFNFSDNVNAQAGLDVTGGDITLTGNSSTLGLTINNTDTSHDSVMKFQSNNVSKFTMGIDGSDSNKFKIGTTAVGTSTRLTIDPNGNTALSGDLSVTGAVTGTGFIIGSANINESDLEKIDDITDGTASANKAVVLDSSRNISNLGTIGCGAITSSGAVTGTGFIIGSANINESDLEKIDDITDGTATANKAVVLDSSRNISNLGTIGCGAITSSGAVTGTGFIIGSANINESDLEKVDDITDGTATANKAVVLDSSRNISNLGTIGCGAITQSGSGQVTFTGNVDATNGLDVTGAALTTNQSITQTGSSKVTFEGNVGIGTNNPSQKLEVYPDTDCSAIIGRAHIGHLINRPDLASFSHKDKADANNFALLQKETGETILNCSTGENIRFQVNNSEKMRIDSAGNVGIGTTTPQSSLHVAGTRNNTPTVKGIHLGMNGADAGIEIVANSTTNNSFIDFTKPDSDFGGRILYSNNSNHMAFSSNATERMRIDSAGNVGIGVTNPSEKLEVNGNITATGSIRGSASGSVLNMKIYYKETNTNLGHLDKDISSSSFDDGDIFVNSISYTPVSSSSLIYLEYFVPYQIGGNNGDSFASRFYINNSQIPGPNIYFHPSDGGGGGGRSGSLFPMYAHYVNTNGSAISIMGKAKRIDSDDTITIYRSLGPYLKIIEVKS